MQLNFGIIGEGTEAKTAAAGAPFRLAILGDFSGGANKGRLEVGDDLARRKPLRVDVDNIDQVMQRLKITLSLPMGSGEGAVEFPIASIDDFHPDQLYEKVELFSAMADLRQRVTSKSGVAAAAKELVAWRAEPAPPRQGGRPRPRGTTVPRGGKLSDFAKLIGQPSARPEASEIAIEDLLKSVVRPYIVKAKDPAQAALLGSLDKALAATMRKILHHPDFQILEALWRSVDLLTRRLETNTQLQIVLYDVSAEELAADLSSQDELEQTGIFKLLVEQPSVDANQGALSALIGNYMFDHTPPQAELLGRVAKIAAQANAPFISAINPDFLKTKAEDIHPLIRQAWDGLSGLDEAKFIALVTPRFLLRQPYGDRTDPIDSFDDFEEFTPQAGLKGLLWGNPAIVAGLMLGMTFSKQGAKMNLGSIMSVNEIPYYFYVDEDGDQTALPCTERLMSERVAALVRAQRFLPLLSIKGRPEVRLGGFNSLAGPAIAGRWPDPVGNVIKPDPVIEEVAEGDGEASEDGGDGSDDSGSSDDDLDGLMSSLDDTPSEDGSEEPSSDDAAAEEGGEGEMDPELAELLKGL
jgi:type VI secretion system ImpC/EvpB family protein/type VI secretion system ImpB/VipA family protein